MEFPGDSALKQEIELSSCQTGDNFCFFSLLEEMVSELTIGELVRQSNLKSQISTVNGQLSFFFPFSIEVKKNKTTGPTKLLSSSKQFNDFSNWRGN